MRRTLFLILTLLTITGSLWGQSSSGDNSFIDEQIDQYIRNEKYTYASNLMVVYANTLLSQGDTLSAYEYQLKNCKLIDEHIDYFKNDGLSTEGYYTNWYTTISMAGWLRRYDEGVALLYPILNKMENEAPELLPFYVSTLTYIIEGSIKYGYGNDSYWNFEDVLQKALNVIKGKLPTRELVGQYLKINKCFFYSFFYISFDGVIFKGNHANEVFKWYISNNDYISTLDTSLYKKEIIDYNLVFVDNINLIASSIGAQWNNNLGAIKLYGKSVEVLLKIKHLSSTINQKIASCYANISKEYYSIGNIIKSKEYSDKTVEYLFNYEKNFEYCDILSTIALVNYTIGNNNIATETKFKEMVTREELGWHCSPSDWGLLFMYAKEENPEVVLKYKEEALSKSTSEGGEFGVFQNIGDAYSLLMNEKKEYKDSAEFYFHKAIEELESHGDYWRKYDLTEKTLSNIYKSWSEHYIRLKDYNKAYEYALKAVQLNNRNNYHVSVLAAMLHDTASVHKFLPLYYNDLEDELSKMVSTLGSVESNIYLKNGESTPYHIPEWASWNPTDSVSVCFAYDAALLTNGIFLKYNTFAPYIENNLIDASEKLKLDRMKDSIYAITDVDQMFLALYKYEQTEREMQKMINVHLTNVHWHDIKSHLGKGEACVEFVKYTANAYPWSEEKTKTHYAALVLSDDKKSPVFVDLFDEDVLYDVYNLQPKSYDTEVGATLFYELWGKLHNYIAGKSRVSFSPKGLLNLINIESLADSNGLIALNKYNLKRVSSTKEIINPSKKASLKSVVSYGGIDYAEMAEVITDSLNTRGNWNYLKNTLSEVNSIETSFNHNNIFVTTVTGKNATETSFKSLDGTNANVIHVASHGFYIPVSMRGSIPYYSKSDYTKNIQDELFYSGLIMSGGQYSWEESRFEAEKNDGILTSYEISKLDLHNVGLVVLSACETGIGDELYDGIYGLQRAFKKAGARSILMSLWQIDDKATSEYMSLFYEKLANGTSMHDAYTSTVNAMKEKYKDPNYWASFILLD